VTASACQALGLLRFLLSVVIQTAGDTSLKSEGVHRRALNLAWESRGLVGKR